MKKSNEINELHVEQKFTAISQIVRKIRYLEELLDKFSATARWDQKARISNEIRELQYSLTDRLDDVYFMDQDMKKAI